MKLHVGDPGIVARLDQRVRKQPCQEGLADARSALQDQVLLAFQPIENAFDLLLVQERSCCKDILDAKWQSLNLSNGFASPALSVSTGSPS